MTPPPDRIRLGDVWLDLQGRRHRGARAWWMACCC